MEKDGSNLVIANKKRVEALSLLLVSVYRQVHSGDSGACRWNGRVPNPDRPNGSEGDLLQLLRALNKHK